jgi:hypothetical protein
MAVFPVTANPTLIQPHAPDSGASVQNTGTTVVYLCTDSGASLADAVALQPGYIIPWSAPLWALCAPNVVGVLNLIPVPGINYAQTAQFVPQSKAFAVITPVTTFVTVLPDGRATGYALGQVAVTEQAGTSDKMTFQQGPGSSGPTLLQLQLPANSTTVFDFRGLILPPQVGVVAYFFAGIGAVTLFYN